MFVNTAHHTPLTRPTAIYRVYHRFRNISLTSQKGWKAYKTLLTKKREKTFNQKTQPKQKFLTYI